MQAEWGFVYNGSVLVSAVDENGKFVNEKLEYGDIWYFPKGAAHTVQGLDDHNEFLLVFDEADFEKVGYVSSGADPKSRARPVLTLWQNNLQHCRLAEPHPPRHHRQELWCRPQGL